MGDIVELHPPPLLSVSLMAHSSRSRYVLELLARLDCQVEVAWDVDNDRWETGRRALLSHVGKGSSFGLVLQDDAVIPDGLYEGCLRMLAHVPDDVPVSLYLGTHRNRPRRYSLKPVVEATVKAGASFLACQGPWFGVGIIVPTADIPALVTYGDANPRGTANYDIRIAQFYATLGIDCWHPLPSVIDHREGESLVGKRGSRRHAAWYEPDIATRTWDGGVVTPAELGIARFPVTP